MSLKEWFYANKVFILGLLASIATVLQEYLNAGETSGKVIVYAAFVAVASYLANNLRGQWQTIAAAVGTLVTTVITMQQAGTISWSQVVLQAVILLIGIAVGPTKAVGYEHTETVREAKAEGRELNKSRPSI